MPIESLGYLRLESNDLPAWKVFAGDFLGLMPIESADESLRYRMDDFPQRLVVAPGAESKMTAMGFEVLNKRDLGEVVAKVESAGIKVTTGTVEECAERRVTGFARFDDPAGNPVELFYGPVLDHRTVQLPTVSGFVTDDMGMGHVIVTGEDGQALYDFYVGLLGFFERNTMGGRENPVWFLSPNERHHTLGIAQAPGPGRLIHLMVEGESLDDVGRALDRAAELNVPMMHSLGKHTNDYMVSFYVWSPENYAIEFGYGGRRVEGEAATYEITEGAFWGHKFTPPPGAPGA
ncbi:MAG: VOC family protein [Nocardioides sp.]|uniref:VOC family protein n=1 Tax=Nocardioides sp. TaxID=35761 RepID=UPI0039E2860C